MRSIEFYWLQDGLPIQMLPALGHAAELVARYQEGARLAYQALWNSLFQELPTLERVRWYQYPHRYDGGPACEYPISLPLFCFGQRTAPVARPTCFVDDDGYVYTLLPASPEPQPVPESQPLPDPQTAHAVCRSVALIIERSVLPLQLAYGTGVEVRLTRRPDAPNDTPRVRIINQKR